MIMADAVKQLNKPSSGSRSGGREVEFTLNAPDAKNVSIAGPFNDWNTKTTPMKKGKDGSWKIKLKLPPGKCEYKYFVDGSWLNDIAHPESAPNPFGTSNCVITVQ